jgi:hypothetical protein
VCLIQRKLYKQFVALIGFTKVAHTPTATLTVLRFDQRYRRVKSRAFARHLLNCKDWICLPVPASPSGEQQGLAVVLRGA